MGVSSPCSHLTAGEPSVADLCERGRDHKIIVSGLSSLLRVGGPDDAECEHHHGGRLPVIYPFGPVAGRIVPVPAARKGPDRGVLGAAQRWHRARREVWLLTTGRDEQPQTPGSPDGRGLQSR
jgi:hypothetical protein